MREHRYAGSRDPQPVKHRRDEVVVQQLGCAAPTFRVAVNHAGVQPTERAHGAGSVDVVDPTVSHMDQGIRGHTEL